MYTQRGREPGNTVTQRQPQTIHRRTAAGAWRNLLQKTTRGRGDIVKDNTRGPYHALYGGGGGEDPSVTTPHFARIFFHSDSIFSATQSVRDGVPQCSFSNFFEIKRNKNDSPIPRRRVNATNVYVLNKSRDFEEDDGFDMCLKCILSGQKECNIEFNSLVFAYEHFYYYYD